MILFPDSDEGLGGLFAGTVDGVPTTLDMGQGFPPHEDKLGNLGINARLNRLQNLINGIAAGAGGTLFPKGFICFTFDSGFIPDGWLECNAVNAGVHNGVLVRNLSGRVFIPQGANTSLGANDRTYTYNVGDVQGWNVHGYYNTNHVNDHTWPTATGDADDGENSVASGADFDVDVDTHTHPIASVTDEIDNRMPSIAVIAIIYVGTD